MKVCEKQEAGRQVRVRQEGSQVRGRKQMVKAMKEMQDERGR